MSSPSSGAIIATALVVLAAGCGGSPRSASSPKTAPPQSRAIAFSRCMRSHGVSTFPDPTGSGAIPKVGLQQLGVTVARFQTAQSACNHLLPHGGHGPSPAQVQYVKELSLRFARCVRSHGVPGFPDPGSDGRIPDPASVGIDQGSPRFEAANHACGKYRPPYLPSNAAYNVYARTHGQ